jgi:glycosyltransferase involved in cell wall biosynthesis
LRIGINALFLLPGKVGGSEVYIRNLVKWLARVDPANEYFIFINRESSGVFEEIAPSVKVVQSGINAVSRPKRILYEQFVLPLKTRSLKLDVLLSAGMTSPFYCSVPSVVVIFDLQHINLPENFPRGYLVFLRSIIRISARTSTKVITISTKSKDDLVRFYRIKPRDVIVTHMAVDRGVFFRRSREEIASVRKRFGLPERFILYIASSLPHKNYERLLEAFSLVKKRIEGVKLVLIGARDYGHDVIAAKIKELELTNDVVFLGWLPFEDIPLVYAASELFVFPSLHEGFGIPVLEAFATGVPVVCSNIEPIKEVAGDGARLVDPMDPADIAGGILEVLTDMDLRRRLIQNGLKWSETFSWEKTARETLATLESVVKRPKEV